MIYRHIGPHVHSMEAKGFRCHINRALPAMAAALVFVKRTGTHRKGMGVREEGRLPAQAQTSL